MCSIVGVYLIPLEGLWWHWICWRRAETRWHRALPIGSFFSAVVWHNLHVCPFQWHWSQLSRCTRQGVTQACQSPQHRYKRLRPWLFCDWISEVDVERLTVEWILRVWGLACNAIFIRTVNWLILTVIWLIFWTYTSHCSDVYHFLILFMIRWFNSRQQKLFPNANCNCARWSILVHFSRGGSDRICFGSFTAFFFIDCSHHPYM